MGVLVSPEALEVLVYVGLGAALLSFTFLPGWTLTVPASSRTLEKNLQTGGEAAIYKGAS